MNAPLTPVLVTTPWPRGAAALEETLARLSVDALELLRADVAEPVRAPLPPEEAARRHTLALPARGAPLHAVMDDVVALLRAAPATSGPRFFNQLFAGRDPVAAPADMLASLANHSMYTYKVAGPLVLMELEVLRGLRRALGYPEGEGGGCSRPAAASPTSPPCSARATTRLGRARARRGCRARRDSTRRRRTTTPCARARA